MKRTITIMTLVLGFLQANAQFITAVSFETFTLSANSAYSPTTSTPFQANYSIFDYKYSGYWSGGFAYTNIQDSITAGFGNLYGVRPLKGYGNTDQYAVGQDRAKITLTIPQATVNGFYITNTTYAYKSIAQGDAFARKFGDTTGTGSGTTIPQGSYPDFFKVIVKGYKNGALKNDSVTVMLADFTYTNNAQDFILATWQYVNTSNIGEVDSLKFFIRSSDVGAFGINTPLYFAMDDFTTAQPVYVGIAEPQGASAMEVSPNPFHASLTIKHAFVSEAVSATVLDLHGKTVFTTELVNTETHLDLSMLQSGAYFLELRSGNQRSVKKLIKN